MGNATKVKTNVVMKERPSLDRPRMGNEIKRFDKAAAIKIIQANLSKAQSHKPNEGQRDE